MKRRRRRSLANKLGAKGVNQVRHALRRARDPERLGINLNEEQYWRLVKQIKRQYRPPYVGRAVFVGKESIRVSFWFVWFGEREMWLPVVYDSVRKTIVTFLPRGALGNNPPPPGSAPETDSKSSFLSEKERKEFMATLMAELEPVAALGEK